MLNASISLRDLTMRPAKPPHRRLGRPPMPPHFTPLERVILATLPNPGLTGIKNMAYAIGISEGALKIHLIRIYKKLGIPGTVRLATIWAMTHEHVLPAITIP